MTKIAEMKAQQFVASMLELNDDTLYSIGDVLDKLTFEQRLEVFEKTAQTMGFVSAHFKRIK
jgi:hypothetical protein